MTIARKITLLVSGTVLLMGAALTLFLFNRDYPVAFPVSFAGFGALLVLLFALLSYPIIRRITAPISRVKAIAGDIAAGRLNQPVEPGDFGELASIATAFNAVLSREQDAAAREETDHQKFKAQWEERVSQLAQRNDELNNEVREAAKTQEYLWQLAYHDGLTSLPNKHLFMKQLEQFLQLAQRNGEQLALLLLDLDNFKQINDSLGRTLGDLVLKEVAVRVQGCVRDTDVVGYNADPGSRLSISRLGGDEFSVVLNQVDKAESAALVAQRIIESLREPIVVNDQEVTVSTSIGISLAPGDAFDTGGLLKAADTARYYAKKGSKSGFSYYQNQMDEPRMDQQRLKIDLRAAAKRNELELHYQPQIDIRNGAVVGAEALLRWNHPEQGLIPPLQFIPLAEEMDIISEMGKWTLQETCRQLNEFDEIGVKLPMVTVNVSALQFNSEFIGTVKQVLNGSGVNPARLQLELTEGAIITDVGSTIEALNELKAFGVNISIDDFGTGYSPLSYLSRFPLDELKIDRHFVIKSQESETDANLVTGFIAMASCMKLRLVAAGVESREQFQFLTSNGAYILQGYLFSAPVTAEKLQPLLAPWHFMRQLSEMADEQDDAKALESPEQSA